MGICTLVLPHIFVLSQGPDDSEAGVVAPRILSWGKEAGEVRGECGALVNAHAGTNDANCLNETRLSIW